MRPGPTGKGGGARPRREDRSDRVVLVTGATGLLGRLVIAELLGRGARVLALLRPDSPFTVDKLASSVLGLGELEWEKVTLLRGDVLEADLGLEPEVVATGLEQVTEVIHLARPRAGEEPVQGALAKGADTVIEVSHRLARLKRLVLLSSTEVSGDYPGRFYEDWLDVGQRLYTKGARDALEVELRARRASASVPLCVVRHALLVGHSVTGQAECDGGFARLFAWGQLAARLPTALRPPVPAEGRRFVMISPLDHLAAGLVEIAFSGEVLGAETFCVADPRPLAFSELVELVLDRAGGPPPGLRVPVEGKGALGRSVAFLARAGVSLAGVLGRSSGVGALLLRRGEHDTTNASRILEPAGICPPPLPTYFDALYQDYQRRHDRSRR